MEKCVAALDIGTYSCKAAIYCARDRNLYSASRGYGLLFPRPGYVEQDPGTWFRAAIDAFSDALRKVPGAADKIAAISISGTNGLVMVDEQGEPVHNAVMFSDRRSERQAADLARRYGTLIEEIAGNRPAPGSFSLPIINWFREEQPELWQKVRTILVPAGYVIMKLTGRRTIDTSRASMTLFFDQGKRRWSEELRAWEGIPGEVLPQLLEPWDVAGEVTPEAARLLGIKPGVPVLAGCVDTVAACVGMGNIAPGRATLMLGTTGRVVLTIDSARFDGRFINQCHALPGLWICTGAMSSSGGSLKWFVDSFGRLEQALEGQVGVSSYQLVDMAAARSPAGSRGVIYLPYLSGERSPPWNSRARGVFFGLSDGSTYSDVARSVMEGVAFSFKDNLMTIEQATGTFASGLMMGGGGARSRLWRQILADVLERPIEIPEVLEAETLGSIALAGHASHLWGSMDEAVHDLVKVSDTVLPDTRNSDVYRRQFRVFKDLYAALVPVFEEAAG
ncbi:MAG TPA: hypothetical protein GX506_05745 [Firmicutes bacterium]|nr:hypothetical protein [Bacillota bacterium]